MKVGSDAAVGDLGGPAVAIHPDGDDPRRVVADGGVEQRAQQRTGARCQHHQPRRRTRGHVERFGHIGEPSRAVTRRRRPSVDSASSRASTSDVGGAGSTSSARLARLDAARRSVSAIVRRLVGSSLGSSFAGGSSGAVVGSASSGRLPTRFAVRAAGLGLAPPGTAPDPAGHHHRDPADDREPEEHRRSAGRPGPHRHRRSCPAGRCPRTPSNDIASAPATDSDQQLGQRRQRSAADAGRIVVRPPRPDAAPMISSATHTGPSGGVGTAASTGSAGMSPPKTVNELNVAKPTWALDPTATAAVPDDDVGRVQHRQHGEAELAEYRIGDPVQLLHRRPVHDQRPRRHQRRTARTTPTRRPSRRAPNHPANWAAATPPTPVGPAGTTPRSRHR